ncbi:MAG: hypothetical protein H7039_09300 [Bryobacteraceae bacterium]|nr:hypothetical protein [Bryobacteraceae bacterium]
MSERIYKLQPDRTLSLRGFDDLGASAALHSAKPDSFVVSGMFRDPADFAVLILHDADNFYEHPRIKHLPDFVFDGLTLSFDLAYSGIMPLDSPKFPTIDWPYLSAIRADGTSANIRLSDYATVASGAPVKAACKLTVVGDAIQGYDRLTLWYGNLAFDYIAPLTPVTPADVAQALAASINATNWTVGGSLIPLTASASGADLTITAATPGEDGNMLSILVTWKNERLRTSETSAALTGGTSTGSWHLTLDFAALNLKQVRLMWMTFAPKLANSAAYADTEWEASFTNWTLSGPETLRRLSVAGPGTVRVEDADAWCTYTGSWELEQGFFSEGYARKALAAGSKVRIKYASTSVHDLYIGTSLFSTAGSLTATVDGIATTPVDCRLSVDAPVNTRRKLKAAVPAGEHIVELTAFSGFRFDFLEAAVAGDLPAPLPADPRVSPALDYSTDHTYKLPPARIHWIFDQLGFAGPMNEYIGVFWWNQRKRENALIGQVQITFAGTFADGETIFLRFGTGPSTLMFGKSVFPADTPETIAKHFALFLNGSSVGVWAAVSGTTLTITSRSPRPAYRIPFSTQVASAAGTVTMTGALDTGDAGAWVIDVEQTPALNRGARDWHADMFRECKRRNRQIVVAESMELVNPPEGFGAVYPDNKIVETDIGFGSLKSTHCNFGPAMRNYQIAALTHIASLMSAAGLVPEIQLGEFLWWFFTNRTAQNPNGGMAFYDTDTKTAAQAALGRQLTTFRSPDDDPSVNGGADMRFLRSRLHAHVTAIMSAVRSAHPGTQFELLFPYDVNYPTPTGVHQLGGRLNSTVNLPTEWHNKASSGFDRIKTEALDFGAWCRDLNLSSETIELPRKLGWERENIRHLVPIFQPGYAWDKQVAMALAECPIVNLWAWDHICLFGLTISPKTQGRSTLMAA